MQHQTTLHSVIGCKPFAG